MTKTSLKQVNKTHKATYRSKRQLNSLNFGRIQNVKAPSLKQKKVSKADRRNNNNIKRKKSILSLSQALSSCGGANGPPLLCVIVPLAESCSPSLVAALLRAADSSANVTRSASGTLHIISPVRFKKRLEVRVTQWGSDSFFQTLDAAKVADVLICLCPSDASELTDESDALLSSLYGQGVGTVSFVFCGSGLNAKQRQSVRKSLHSRLSDRFSLEGDIRCLENTNDGLTFLRKLTSQRLRQVTYREVRPHMMAEEWQYCADSERLMVSGYLRGGRGLSVNSWMHVPGWGDFPLEQMDGVPDPHPLRTGQVHKHVEEVLATADPRDAGAEDEWNEVVDVADTASVATTRDDDFSESEEDMDAEEEMSSSESDGERPVEIDDIRDAESEAPDVWPEGRSVTWTESEDARSLARFREARQEAQFPDEIDTPRDTPARERFSKYRGLESLRTSRWDPEQDLPMGYEQLLRFQNYTHTCTRLVRRTPEIDVCASPGRYIRLHLSAVPSDLVTSLQTGPLVLFALMPHEHRSTVVHCVGRLASDAECPLKSKDSLVIQLGFRRLSVAPLLSEYGQCRSHQSRALKFLTPGDTGVLSFRAPVVLAPLPLLAWRPNSTAGVLLTGSLLSCDPRRCIIKRVLLSGHPFKVNKRHAVVRYMFFNPDDVRYFKSVEVHTKRDKRGHIREPLGTHGHMKCVFNGPVTNMDVVLMPLYKRVFPKITYNPRADALIKSQTAEQQVDSHLMELFQ